MNLDPKTVVFINIVGCLLMSAGLWFASGYYFKKLRMVKAWSLATLLQGIGWIVMGALRGQIPDWMSISFGNTFIFLSIVFYHAIIVNLFGKKTNWKIGVISASVMFGILVIYQFSTFPQQYRISILSLFPSVYFLLTAKTIYIENKKQRLTGNFLFYFFLFSGLFLFGRFLVYTFTEVSVTQIAFGKGPIQDVTYLLFYIISVLMTFGFLLMCIDIFIKGQIQDEEKYKSLAENSTDIIWVWNFDLEKFTYVSPSITQVTGYSVQEASDHHLSKTYTKESYSKLEELLLPRMEDFRKSSMKIPYAYELEQVRKDGSTIWIETNTVFQKNQNSEIELLGVSRNIDGRKKSEAEMKRYFKELELLNHTKDKFFSIISHDLKGPIGGMNTFIGMLLEDMETRSPKRMQNDLNILYQSSGEVYALLENLLTWARSQTNEISFLPENVSVKTLVDTVISYFTFMTENKGIRIQNLVENDVFVFADENMLETILRNLVSNAIKYSHVGGQVKISAVPTDGNVSIQVEDFGTGISNEIRSTFFQIDAKQKSMPGTLGERGTTLGLILCKEFIEKNNGKIFVESVVGKGSKFYFTLPKGK
ncbi:PAS domain-containing sensor histidine kinase [Leptospira levettii]|uniref:PAS domain-containing sensor histidine kinase n=1 Tax=Leptospira levettii TaxID=2023178 RepID=UPI00223DBCA8|nr:PAS domain-containing sensor histidine kinase [Leptospira levettii]MCW7509723.1 PAS domain-containing sensor histidine kinase [Leptospira levettii]MCW7520810.1 PAS domain-containing sensor histidine kinase [Leptospira levettii]